MNISAGINNIESMMMKNNKLTSFNTQIMIQNQIIK
jgi:hypothetical protein